MLTGYPRSRGRVRARFASCNVNAMRAISEASVCTRGNLLQPCMIHAASLALALLYLNRFLGVQMSYVILRAWYSCRGNPGLESWV